MIPEPKSQIGLQNDQKSIRFIDKTHMAFRHVAKPYKTCRKLRFLDTLWWSCWPPAQPIRVIAYFEPGTCISDHMPGLDTLQNLYKLSHRGFPQKG